MKIILAKNKYIKEISTLMLADLKKPNPKFTMEMISHFREHAKEENIIKEFYNPKLISFLALQNNKLVGFIVGYEEDTSKAMIHYVNGNNINTKKLLLNRFLTACKNKNLTYIKTDTFEFMENNDLFKSAGFVLIKKEKLSDSLEMLWYKLKL